MIIKQISTTVLSGNTILIRSGILRNSRSFIIVGYLQEQNTHQYNSRKNNSISCLFKNFFGFLFKPFQCCSNHSSLKDKWSYNKQSSPMGYQVKSGGITRELDKEPSLHCSSIYINTKWSMLQQCVSLMSIHHASTSCLLLILHASITNKILTGCDTGAE